MYIIPFFEKNKDTVLKRGGTVALLVFSFFLSVILTPLSVVCAERVGALDIPDGGRKLHARPTARLGGLAVFVSVLFAGLLFLPDGAMRGALLSGGALLCCLGVSDDVFSLPPILKLFAEAAIAFLPAAFSLYPRSFSLFSYVFNLPVWAGIAFSVLWTVVLSNAYNLVDGMDMLASSQALVAAAALSFYAGEAWLLFGSVLGFLPYNRRALGLAPLKSVPTRSFLGDTGALFIGYALAVLSLALESFSLPLVLLFAVPLYELLSSFFRRAARGQSPFRADRLHLHHRLADKGFSSSFTVFLLFLYALLFSSFGVLFIEIFK